MSFKPLTSLRRGFGMFWRGLDATRRFVFNILFLLLLIALLLAIFGGGTKPLGKKTALVLELRGDLVEEHTGGLRDTLLSNVGGEVRRTVELRDVLEALDAAAKDPRIASLVLVLDDFGGAGLSGLREVAAAIDRFKASGKKVLAWGSSYDQRSYLLACARQRGADAPDGHADDRRFRPLPQLLRRCAAAPGPER
jgi:protease-4